MTWLIPLAITIWIFSAVWRIGSRGGFFSNVTATTVISSPGVLLAWAIYGWLA